MPKIKVKNIPLHIVNELCDRRNPCERCPLNIDRKCAFIETNRLKETVVELPEKDFPTNREWMESMSDEDLAAFYTLGIPLKDNSYISLYKVAMSFTSSQQGIKEWLSKPCLYLMEE